MKRILCWLGWHDYQWFGNQFLYAAFLLGYRCTVCGKVKWK